MAKSIIQRISLEGGAAIKAQLEAIGAAGQKAFSDLQGAVTSNRAFGNIGTAIEGVRARAAALSGGAKQLGSDMGALGGAVTRTASIFGVAFAGSVTGAVTTLAALVKGSGEAAASLQRAADAAGITTTEFQQLAFAGGKVDLESDDITKVLTRINKLADDQVQKNLKFEQSQANLRREFARGEVGFEAYNKGLRDLREKADDDIDIFQRLGVSVLDSTGNVKSSKDLLLEFADAIKAVPNAANRAGLSLEITGNRNSKFNSLIGKGSEGLAAFNKEMERVAPAITPLQIAVGTKLNSAFKGLQATIASTKTTILTLFAPDETRLVKAFQQLIVDNRDKLIDMASAIAQKVTPIVDDLIAVMQGRDKDVKNNIILVIRDGVVQLGADIKNAVTNIILPAFATLLKILDTIASAINGIFGTKLTGGQIAIAIIVAKVIGVFGIFATAVSVAVSAIGLLVAALGGALPAALAAIAFAIGFVLVRALQSIPWAALAKAAQDTWTAITSSVASVRNAIVNAFDTAINFVVSAWNGVLSFFAGIGTAIGGFFNDAAILVSNAFNTSVQFITDLWNGLVSFFAGLPATIGGFFVSVGNAIVSAFQTAVDTVKQFFTDLWTKVTGIFNDIIAKARAVVNAVKSAVGLGGGSDKSAPGFAGGGPVRGRGTARSDSILAWLSNGEYIMPARAVQQFGVGFMNAIRSGVMPGFNVGGFVDAITPRRMGLPAFADGGFAGAGGALRPAVINFDGNAFAVQAGDDVLGQMARAAMGRRMRSAGKKPSFVGVV